MIDVGAGSKAERGMFFFYKTFNYFNVAGFEPAPLGNY